MSNEQEGDFFVLKTFVNSFKYLYDDAVLMLQFSKDPQFSQSFKRTEPARTSLILFILSLEGLINRATATFLPAHLKSFFLDKEKTFSFEDKYVLLPLLLDKSANHRFDRGAYPWSHFKELIAIRNDFVHPKYARAAFYSMKKWGSYDCLDPDAVPKNSDVKPAQLIYPQTKIPRDPYCILPEHADTAKKVADDMVCELDRLLDGRIRADDWLTTDNMQLVYPEGAKLGDIPGAPFAPEQTSSS